MKNLQRILSEIVQLTSSMETNYPELYQFLDETPITIPSTAHPDLTELTLTEYLEDLKELLKHHLQTHKNKLA
ncbi:hypothetical protein [Maribacter halichondriae]|uniref:hypothetical protein n=1 Tax=Maribacter halichondriae TaxID=2980554 RepID=UPI002359603E|nr:hypothetical protein [Maribacter sp. Hal144]